MRTQLLACTSAMAEGEAPDPYVDLSASLEAVCCYHDDVARFCRLMEALQGQGVLAALSAQGRDLQTELFAGAVVPIMCADSRDTSACIDAGGSLLLARHAASIKGVHALHALHCAIACVPRIQIVHLDALASRNARCLVSSLKSRLPRLLRALLLACRALGQICLSPAAQWTGRELQRFIWTMAAAWCHTLSAPALPAHCLTASCAACLPRRPGSSCTRASSRCGSRR